MRILIVEDHTDSARLLARLLKGHGHYTHATHSVVDAVAANALAEPFDLLISDVRLPDGSGLDLMPLLKEAGVRCGIAISGAAEDEGPALAAGFAAHLLKPLTWERLLEALRNVIEHHCPPRSSRQAPLPSNVPTNG